jgi:hypothetical protein
MALRATTARAGVGQGGDRRRHLLAFGTRLHSYWLRL